MGDDAGRVHSPPVCRSSRSVMFIVEVTHDPWAVRKDVVPQPEPVGHVPEVYISVPGKVGSEHVCVLAALADGAWGPRKRAKRYDMPIGA